MSIQALIGTPERKQQLVRCASIGAGVLVIILGIFFGWRMYVSYREESAHAAFAQQLDLYNQAKAGKNTWANVEMAFKVAHSQHSGSYLAPYFLAFQADALVQQQKTTEALMVMNTMLDALPHSSPFYGLYAGKRALIKLDSNEQTVQQEGLQELTALAQDVHNVHNDMAQFYLASYNWSKNNVDQARQLWQSLADANKQAAIASPWATMAADKLEQIA